MGHGCHDCGCPNMCVCDDLRAEALAEKVKKETTMQHTNVVFVVDESGSMNGSGHDGSPVRDVMYYVDRDLYEDAEKALHWYETTGMKVAKTPSIPHVVASWLVRKTKPDLRVAEEC